MSIILIFYLYVYYRYSNDNSFVICILYFKYYIDFDIFVSIPESKWYIYNIYLKDCISGKEEWVEFRYAYMNFLIFLTYTKNYSIVLEFCSFVSNQNVANIFEIKVLDFIYSHYYNKKIKPIFVISKIIIHSLNMLLI